MAEPSTDEMEQFQQLSDQYQPNLPGPLIGSKKPLSELVTEYSQADPAFVAKTKALETTHSAYRQIKGDGQCGWRGVVFGYFEMLFKSNDAGLVTQELVRIQSYEQTMRSAGIDYDIIIDMFDYTWELFNAIKTAIDRGNTDEAVLLQFLNDENISNSIVYHFKMMTSAWMELYPDRYEAFLEMTVQQYRLTRIDPSNQEIDHVGLQALTDAVIAPAYMAVDVSYLDRTSGDEVNTFQFVDNANGWPTIRLIYRPGHYDIVYKEVQPRTTTQQPLTVYVQTSASCYVPQQQSPVFDCGDTATLADLSTTFPFATFATPDQPTTYSQRDFHHDHLTKQQRTYRADHMICTDHIQTNVFRTAVPQYPDLARSLSLPMHPCSPAVHHTSLSTAPSPRSSASPASPIEPVTRRPRQTKIRRVPTTPEPVIRLSVDFFTYHLGNNKSLPLDQATCGSASVHSGSFLNSKFQPLLYSPNEEHGR